MCSPKPNPLDAFQAKVCQDYRSLCNVIGLDPVPVDVYEVDLKSEARTALGTPVKNCTPLYDTKIIVLPVLGDDLTASTTTTEVFPPTSWDKFTPSWPQWRIELWHEVLHQVEKDVFDDWKGGEHHGESYRRAIEFVSSKLSPIKPVSPELLRVIALGF